MNILRYLTFLLFGLFFGTEAKGTLIDVNDINIFSFSSEQGNNRYNLTQENILRKTNKRHERAYDYSLPHPITTLAAHTDGAVALSYEQNSFYFISNRPCRDDLKTVSLHGRPMDVYIDGDQVYVTVQPPSQPYGDLMIYSRTSHALVTTVRLHPNARLLAGNSTCIFVAHGKDAAFRSDQYFCGTGITIIPKADFSKQTFQRTSESPHFIYADDQHVFITTKVCLYFLMGTAPSYTLEEKRVAFGPQHLLVTPQMTYVLSEFSKNLQGLDSSCVPKRLSMQLDGHPKGLCEVADAIVVLTQNKDLLYFFEKLTLRHMGTLRVARFPFEVRADLNDLLVLTAYELTSIPESTYKKFILKNQEINAQAASFDALERKTESPSLSDCPDEDDFDITPDQEEE